MKLFKNFILVLTMFLFSGCSLSSLVSYQENREFLTINNEKIFISEGKKRLYPNTCVYDSYTVNDENSPYGKIFFESIDLSHNCKWNGFPRGYFQNSIDDVFKFKAVSFAEKIDVDGYEFITLKINNDKYLSLIYKYLGGTEKLIIDYEGRLSETLIKKFKPEYNSIYKSMTRYKGTYDKSLVRQNPLKGYFSIESETFAK